MQAYSAGNLTVNSTDCFHCDWFRPHEHNKYLHYKKKNPISVSKLRDKLDGKQVKHEKNVC